MIWQTDQPIGTKNKSKPKETVTEKAYTRTSLND